MRRASSGRRMRLHEGVCGRLGRLQLGPKQHGSIAITSKAAWNVEVSSRRYCCSQTRSARVTFLVQAWPIPDLPLSPSPLPCSDAINSNTRRTQSPRPFVSDRACKISIYSLLTAMSAMQDATRRGLRCDLDLFRDTLSHLSTLDSAMRHCGG